ncbi:MAG: ribosomal-processing cysteine protease Prp [Bacillota bacterium]|jgi:uncharacterized protein YsxB (DUF464 family)
MVSVKLAMDRNGQYSGFVCSGHAAYAKHGADIVCAAISILIQTIMAALEEILQIPVEVEADEHAGYLKCTWVNQPDQLERIQLLLKTLVLGLTALQREYPNHISLDEMEV